MVMASIGEMIASAATSVEGGASALTELFAAGDSAAEAGKVAAGAAKAVNPEVSNALAAMGAGEIDVPGANGFAATSVASPTAAKMASDSPFLPTWATKAIGPVLMSLTQAALRPQHNPIAPAGGHGVSASGAGAMKPFQEVEKMANDNPLDGLNQWSRLF